jgi:glycosyltransferase involved in cell wall biosynthesis
LKILDYQVIYRCFCGGTTGIDRASREYLLALDDLGVDVKVEPMSYSKNIFVSGVNPTQIARIKELIEKPLAEDKIKVLIFHAQPNGVNPIIERNTYDYVIVNTVWETTKVPENWIVNANNCDAIFVPSRQNIEALIDSGITSRKFLIPHGTDIETYKPDNLKLNLQGVDGKFIFLSVFQWQHRKAPEVLLEAYLKEFTSKDNVVLIIKTYWGHVVAKNEQRGIINQISGFKNSLNLNDSAKMYVTTSLFDDEDLKGLYTLSDAFVLPTRGEGVGLPFLEALSSGVPVIATAWGGSMDFLDTNNSFLVDYDLMPTDSKVASGISPNFNQLFTSDMKWAEPRVDSLRLQMRTVYENQELTRSKGKAGRLKMERISSWVQAGEIMKMNIEEVISCKQ